MRDKFAPARGSHDVCCCRLQTMVVVAAWCLVASSLLIGGLFFFFSSIFEFAKHLYVKSEEAMVLGIALFLVGFYTASRTVRAALYVGLDRDMELAWAPIYCPGYVCHMCCTSKKERVRFVKEKCGCGCHRCTETCVFCCCNSDPHAKPVQFNQIFNEDEIEYGLRLAESSSDGDTSSSEEEEEVDDIAIAIHTNEEFLGRGKELSSMAHSLTPQTEDEEKRRRRRETEKSMKQKKSKKKRSNKMKRESEENGERKLRSRKSDRSEKSGRGKKNKRSTRRNLVVRKKKEKKKKKKKKKKKAPIDDDDDGNEGESMVMGAGGERKTKSKELKGAHDSGRRRKQEVGQRQRSSRVVENAEAEDKLRKVRSKKKQKSSRQEKHTKNLLVVDGDRVGNVTIGSSSLRSPGSPAPRRRSSPRPPPGRPPNE